MIGRRMALAGLAALGAGLARGATERTERVDGIGARVDIGWDRWGIPHIEAVNLEDALFGQGYAAATLRLWQMDLARRRALGRLAIVFGPDFVPFDLAARTVRFRGDVTAEWAHHDPRVQPLAQAWVRGVNARIAAVLAEPALLPPEFVTLDMEPEPWSTDDLILMRDSAAPNIAGEMRRAGLARHGALALDALAAPLDPPHALSVPAGLDCARLDPSQLMLLHRLTMPLPFASAQRHGDLRVDPDARDGSNAWVIAPERSATGRAILANDPHLPVSVPGPRVICHLRAPGLNAIGAGPAWRPGFQFGHTDRIAFGRTDFQIDQEDLYVLELDADGAQWRSPEGWQPLTRHRETIAVRDGADVTAEVATIPLGPVVFEDRAARHALVARSALRESGPSVALEYLPLLLARNWDEYRGAIRTAVWGSNYLYADVDGNIGWQAGGRAPRRVGYDGLMPVPASGPYRWEGFLSIDELPSQFNPKAGWIASANQMPFPPGWNDVTSREWIPDDRYRRIEEVLRENDHVSLDDCRALQHDTVSLRARALRPVIDALQGPGAEALRAWDGMVTAESEAAALYELWSAELNRQVRLVMVPEAVRAVIPALHPHVVIALVTGAEPGLPDRMALAQTALTTAAQALGKRPPDARHWGAMHRLDLHHALGDLVPGMQVEGGGSGGDGATVQARWWAGPAATQISGGASFAAVIDLGDLARTRGINMPGQSGDPRSPHYADLAPLWIAGETIPLATDDPDITEKISLLPG